MIPLIILAIENPDDREFMENLYLTNKELMYGKIMRNMKDKWAADDVMQSALEKLIANIATLKKLAKEPLVSYIKTTCENEAISYMRKGKKLVYMDDEDVEAVNDTYESPEILLLNKERNEKMYEVFKKLDERSKMILECKYKLKMPDDEIAKTMGIKPGSVRMALTRARNKFKQKYKEIYDIRV